jgi:hypothetical protein
VVFDNAADLDAVARFVPAAGQCQVIITSNRLEAGGLGDPVTVEVFTETEALAFSAERTGRADAAGARELAGELGAGCPGRCCTRPGSRAWPRLRR